MSSPQLTFDSQKANTLSVISALAKETIRIRARRYQRGSLKVLKRKTQPDAWWFRYYTQENGRRVYKRQFVGSVLDFPNRKDAEKAIMQLRVDINEGARCAPLNIEQLAAHYMKDELPRKAYATILCYTDSLDDRIVPKWGSYPLSAIKSIEVEKWLEGLKRKKDGKPVSPATRSKIRNVMSTVFAHAIRYGWATHNPISAVRTSAKRLRDPEFLTPEETQVLLMRLDQRQRAVVLLDTVAGLRRGELFELRWRDVDFEAGVADVTRSIYRNVVGDTKTVASRKPVPLHPLVLDELKKWRAESIYRADSDYILASVQMNGKQPLQPDTLFKRHIRTALEEMGVNKRITWHSFRHGLGTMLRQMKVDVKVAQELLRHANPRITLEFYQQAVTDEKREAQELALKGFLGSTFPSAPISNQIGVQKEEVIAASR
jgi:integrase